MTPLPQSIPPELAEKVADFDSDLRKLKRLAAQPHEFDAYGNVIPRAYSDYVIAGMETAAPLIDGLLQIITKLENPWQDISTAPRHENVLIVVKSRYNGSSFIAVGRLVEDDNTMQDMWLDWGCDDYIHDGINEVTHWQPLPKPPTATSPQTEQQPEK